MIVVLHSRYPLREYYSLIKKNKTMFAKQYSFIMSTRVLSNILVNTNNPFEID